MTNLASLSPITGCSRPSAERQRGETYDRQFLTGICLMVSSEAAIPPEFTI